MFDYKRLMKQTIVFISICVLSTYFVGCNMINNILPKKTSSKVGGINITCAVSQGDDIWTQEDLEEARYILEKRVQQYNTLASVRSEGDDHIIIDIPGEYDIDIVDSLLSSGELYFCTATDHTPTDEELANNKYVKITDDIEYKGYYQVWITGDQIEDASGETITNEFKNTEYIIDLTFTGEGSEALYRMTSAYVGQQVYIIYDDSVISAPKVMSAISNGEAQIDRIYSLEEAEALASNIRIGSLNLNLDVIGYKVTEPQ